MGGASVSARVVHMIGNAHIDPVWLWQWPEGYQEVRATFASAIERMREYPEFVFTCDSVLYMAWVEEHDPDLFGAIAEQIADGRWQVVGGWWIEPDCNLPGGESFVRQALYAQRYLRAKLDVTATVGCNVDPFGHNAMLPQLLMNRLRYGRYLDILVTHAPPRHIHDQEDRPHWGFESFRWFLRTFRPRYHLHGHIHIYDKRTVTRTRFHETEVLNAYPYRELHVSTQSSAISSQKDVRASEH